MKQHQKAKSNHVPRRTAIVFHQVESIRYMRMTVVTEEIVLQNQRNIHIIFIRQVIKQVNGKSKMHFVTNHL